jgi:hypothetical protein
MLAREKIITLYYSSIGTVTSLRLKENFSFTFIDAEDYAILSVNVEQR